MRGPINYVKINTNLIRFGLNFRNENADLSDRQIVFDDEDRTVAIELRNQFDIWGRRRTTLGRLCSWYSKLEIINECFCRRKRNNVDFNSDQGSDAPAIQLTEISISQR